MKPPQILPIFSKVIYVDYIDLNKDLILEKIKSLNFESINQENSENFCSISENKRILNTPEFNDLKEKIKIPLKKYVYNILKYHNNEFKITTSWVTKAKTNEQSLAHNHSNSFLSGVLYLKTEPKKADIMFHNYSKNSSWLLEASEYNIYNSHEFTLNMSENLIIFFPSELHHQVLNNNQENERISLAFNFSPVGKVGMKNSDGEINFTCS